MLTHHKPSSSSFAWFVCSPLLKNKFNTLFQGCPSHLFVVPMFWDWISATRVIFVQFVQSCDNNIMYIVVTLGLQTCDLFIFFIDYLLENHFWHTDKQDNLLDKFYYLCSITTFFFIAIQNFIIYVVVYQRTKSTHTDCRMSKIN